MVEIYLILISPVGLEDVFTLLWKWWYLIAMCLVWGVNFNDSAIAMAKRLSSWTVIQKSVMGLGMLMIQLNLQHKIFNWYCLTKSMSHGNILCLCCRKGNFGLKLAAPNDWIVSITNNETSSWKSIFCIFLVCSTPATSKIFINIDFKTFKFANLVKNTMFWIINKISSNPHNCKFVELHQIDGESCSLMNCHMYLRTEVLRKLGKL